jgi:hypothetical protein
VVNTGGRGTGDPQLQLLADGSRLVVVTTSEQRIPGTGVPGSAGFATELPFISIYDTSTHQRIAYQPVLRHVVPYTREVFRRLKFRVAENYITATGGLMRFSDDGRLLAISFGIGFGASEEIGFVFEDEVTYTAFEPRAPSNTLRYTTDAGAHWNNLAINYAVQDYQVFEGDLLCTATRKNGHGYGVLTLHLTK